MKVDSPPPIESVEAFHDLGGRADGVSGSPWTNLARPTLARGGAGRPGRVRVAVARLCLGYQGLDHPGDAGLRIREWPAKFLRPGAPRCRLGGDASRRHLGGRAPRRRRGGGAASRRPEQAPRVGQHGTGNRVPLGGRACQSFSLDHRLVRFWGSRRVPTRVGCSAGIRSIPRDGTQLPSRCHYN